MREDFGTSWRQMKTALLIGGVIGSVVMVAMAAPAWQGGRAPVYSDAVGLALIAGLALPLWVTLTLLLSVRIENDLVSQRVGRFWRLRQGHLDDLTRVDFRCGRSAARLYFRDGTCVRLPVADTRELQALCVHLMEHRPSFDHFVFSPRASKVEKMMQSFRTSSAQAAPMAPRKGHDRAVPGIATRAIPWGGLRRTHMV